jgi:hypothetical protein
MACSGARRGQFALRVRHLLHRRGREANREINFLAQDGCGHVRFAHVPQDARPHAEPVEGRATDINNI